MLLIQSLNKNTTINCPSRMASLPTQVTGAVRWTVETCSVYLQSPQLWPQVYMPHLWFTWNVEFLNSEQYNNLLDKNCYLWRLNYEYICKVINNSITQTTARSTYNICHYEYNAIQHSNWTYIDKDGMWDEDVNIVQQLGWIGIQNQ